MTPIEITSAEWTIEYFAEGWAEGDDTAAVARECADAQYAWLVNNTSAQLSGWTYTSGTFAGEIKVDAPMKILNLIGASVDYVLSVLGEIKGEANACMYHRDAPAGCDAGLGWYRIEGDAWCAAALAAFTAEMGADDPAVLGAVKVA